MDGYADDLAAVIEALDLKDITMVGHSTGGGEVARYIGRYGTKRVAKAVLISAIPPAFMKSDRNPDGVPKEVVDKWVEVFARLAKDPEWQLGNARLGGIAAIRSPAETERFVREQYELYNKLVTSLGIRQ